MVQEGFLPPAASRWHQSVQAYYTKLKTKAHKCQIWLQFNVIEDRFLKYFPEPFANQCRATPLELNFHSPQGSSCIGTEMQFSKLNRTQQISSYLVTEYNKIWLQETNLCFQEEPSEHLGQSKEVLLNSTALTSHQSKASQRQSLSQEAQVD